MSGEYLCHQKFAAAIAVKLLAMIDKLCESSKDEAVAKVKPILAKPDA